jgi:hypothetical protein
MAVLALLFLAGSGASTEAVPTNPTFISRFRNSVKRMARSLISRC